MYLPWLQKYNLLIFDEIDSTNSEAIRLVKANISGNFVIWATKQTAGRGRYGRQWQSDQGNLYTSVILDNNIPITKQPQVSFITALALYDAINSVTKKSSQDLKTFVKWPNDILINDKKVAGILLESITIHKRNYLIIGVGVNISSNPTNVNYPTTSILSENLETETSNLLSVFMGFFDKYLMQWNKTGFVSIRKQWLKRAYKINDIVTINDGSSRISGVFNDIDLNGNIRLKTAGGQIFTLSLGEVLFT